jgi:hypothetical protein
MSEETKEVKRHTITKAFYYSLLSARAQHIEEVLRGNVKKFLNKKKIMPL